MTPHGIMFHHFHGCGHPPSQGSISAGQLDAMIDHLGRERILNAPQWLDRAQTGRLRDGDLCLTFDDNLRCQFDVAYPVLKARGITAFWFVYTSVMQGKLERLEVYRHFRTVHFRDVDEFYRAFFAAVDASEFALEVHEAIRGFNPREYLAAFPFYSDEDRRFRFARDEVLRPQRYEDLMDRMMAQRGVDMAELSRNLWMDADCLRQLDRDGHVIGLHSHTHPTRLERLTPAGQFEEYRANAEHLRQILGREPLTMSHPCNSYTPATLEVLRSIGIVMGFRANMAEPAASPLELSREDHANLMRRMAA